MTERNESGELQAVASPGESLPTHGLIDHIRSLDARVQRIEDKLWPKAEGSGSERYEQTRPEHPIQLLPFASDCAPYAYGSNPPFGALVFADSENKTYGISDSKGNVADVRPVPEPVPEPIPEASDVRNEDGQPGEQG
jgi:hypothetical protein